MNHIYGSGKICGLFLHISWRLDLNLLCVVNICDGFTEFMLYRQFIASVKNNGYKAEGLFEYVMFIWFHTFFKAIKILKKNNNVLKNKVIFHFCLFGYLRVNLLSHTQFPLSNVWLFFFWSMFMLAFSLPECSWLPLFYKIQI